MSTEPIKRGPGRPPKIRPIGCEGFAQVQEPVVTDHGREPTALERIAEINVRRAAGNGYLVPIPQPLTPKSFRDWLREVAVAGAPEDVEIAWHHYDNSEVKGSLLNEYQELKNAAGRWFRPLLAQAEREETAENAAHAIRVQKMRIHSQIAAHKASIVELERKLALL